MDQWASHAQCAMRRRGAAGVSGDGKAGKFARSPIKVGGADRVIPGVRLEVHGCIVDGVVAARDEDPARRRD
jgi:hypothetical protein